MRRPIREHAGSNAYAVSIAAGSFSCSCDAAHVVSWRHVKSCLPTRCHCIPAGVTSCLAISLRVMSGLVFASRLTSVLAISSRGLSGLVIVSRVMVPVIYVILPRVMPCHVMSCHAWLLGLDIQASRYAQKRLRRRQNRRPCVTRA